MIKTLGESKQCVLNRSVVPNSWPPHGLWPTRLLCPWDFSGQNTRVGCHFLFQEIFLTQGSNPHLVHYRQILYHWAPWEAHQNSTKGKNKYASIHAWRNTYRNNIGFQLSFSNLIRCYFWIYHLDPVVILDETLRFINITGHKTHLKHREYAVTPLFSRFLNYPHQLIVCA